MSTQPLRTFQTSVIAVRPTTRVSFDCLLDGAPCLCIAVGEKPQVIALRAGQRVTVLGRRSEVVNSVVEVERISPAE